MNDKIQKNDYSHFLQHILTKIQQARYEMLMSASKQTLLLYWDIGKMVSEKMQSANWGEKVVVQLSEDLQKEIPGVRGFSVRNIRNMKRFYDFYAQFGISATAVAELDEKQICATAVAQIQSDKNSAIMVALNSATAVVELETEKNQPTSVVAVNSATAVAELQNLVYELVTSIGWVQNYLILEKCKDLKQVLFYLRQTKEKGWSKLDLLEKIEQNYFENYTLAQNNFE